MFKWFNNGRIASFEIRLSETYGRPSCFTTVEFGISKWETSGGHSSHNIHSLCLNARKCIWSVIVLHWTWKFYHPDGIVAKDVVQKREVQINKIWMLYLTLMKLHVNQSYYDLGFSSGICRTTVTVARIFKKRITLWFQNRIHLS